MRREVNDKSSTTKKPRRNGRGAVWLIAWLGGNFYNTLLIRQPHIMPLLMSFDRAFIHFIRYWLQIN